MEIITGYTGENHVTSADDASLYRGILGQDDYVLEVGSKFAATIIDNNTVRVMDGDLVIQGHQARIRANDYNEVTVDNGTPGQKRNDLIVARYLKNTETGIESITLEVIKGIPGVTATDPDVVQGNLTIGATQRDYPLYRVSLNGLALENVTSLFSTIPNLKILKTHMAEKASQITLGHIKLQENWINGVFESVWSKYSTGLRYAKNDLGIVTVSFEGTAGTVTNNATVGYLAVGYRPIKTVIMHVFNLSLGEFVGNAFHIGTDGQIKVGQNKAFTTGQVYVGTVSFYGGK